MVISKNGDKMRREFDGDRSDISSIKNFIDTQ